MAGQVFYPDGTRAIAAADGKVTYSGMITTGYLVRVEHENGDVTGYFHGKDGTSLVLAGDIVRRGDPLFLCGWDLSGSLEPTDKNPVHLHFEVQRDGEYMDPEAWLRYASFLPMA